jgi:murein DD-endopeptidase MepM/ murein hydrolase activator NlpD
VNLASRQQIISDQKLEKQRLLTETQNQEKIYEDEIQELAKRQQEIAEEIEAIDEKLRSEINTGLLPFAFKGLLMTPVSGRLSQGYGATAFAQYGYKGKFHNGVDIAAPIGTPVFAAADGTVVASGDQDRYCRRGAYGKFIVIKHRNNLTTLYAHLSKILVQEGNTVGRGDVIGYVGKTGYATGPHLHFTVFSSPTFYMGPSNMCGPMPFGGDLNPLQYVDL